MENNVLLDFQHHVDGELWGAITLKNKETGKEWKGTEFLTMAITFPNQVCFVWPARTI